MAGDEWSVWAGTVEASVCVWAEERERRVRGGPLLQDLLQMGSKSQGHKGWWGGVPLDPRMVPVAT